MKHSIWVICCAVLWFGLTATPASAQEADAVEAPGRPAQEVFKTGTINPPERGETQLSYVSRFSRGKEHSSQQTLLGLEYSVTDRWQIELEWDAKSRRSKSGEATTRGRGDLRISTQYSFMNVLHSDFHGAVGFEVSLPTGDVEKELSEGLIVYEPNLIVARDFPKLNNMQVFAQVGVGFVQRVRRPKAAAEAEPAAHEFNVGTGVFVPFRNLVLTGEFDLSTNRWNNGGREREMYLTPGVMWRLPLNLEIGVETVVGLTRDSDRFRSAVKITYEFSLWRGGGR